MTQYYSKHLYFEFETSKISSLRCKDYTDSNISGFTLKFFNNAGVEQTLEADIAANTVTTQLDFFPAWDYIIQGGYIFQESAPATDIYCYVLFAPDIPANSGGSIEFLTGLNLKKLDHSFMLMPPKELDVKYDPVYYSSKLRFLIKHNAGINHKIGGMIRYL